MPGKRNSSSSNRPPGYEDGMRGLAGKMTRWGELEEREVSSLAYEISQGPDNVDPITNYRTAENILTQRNILQLIEERQRRRGKEG